MKVISLGGTIILLALFVQKKHFGQILVWVLEMPKIGGGGNKLASRWYTPLYEKGLKETWNKSMETTTETIKVKHRAQNKKCFILIENRLY